MAVSSDGLSVVVAGFLDNAVALFSRDPAANGTLALSDRLKAGERLFSRFTDASDDVIPQGGAPSEWDSGSSPAFPVRLGGNANPYSFTARDVAAFSMFQTGYLAIAASAPGPAAAPGAMALYQLDASNGGALRLVQTHTGVPGVSAVAHVGLV